MPLSAIAARFAETYYWCNPSNVYMWKMLREGPWDLIVANDYPTFPLAAAIADVHGVDYIVDCHEYAREQVRPSGVRAAARWKICLKPYIDAIHRRYLPNARVVSTVSAGLADLLLTTYQLAEFPVVIRSVPEYEKHGFRKCGSTIRVLYHGGAAPSRGLESLIDSVCMWRREFKLNLRLVAGEAYLNSLKDRVKKMDLKDRVEFLEPVPFTELVDKASESDIGYHVPLEFLVPSHL